MGEGRGEREKERERGGMERAEKARIVEMNANELCGGGKEGTEGKASWL